MAAAAYWAPGAGLVAYSSRARLGSGFPGRAAITQRRYNAAAAAAAYLTAAAAGLPLLPHADTAPHLRPQPRAHRRITPQTPPRRFGAFPICRPPAPPAAHVLFAGLPPDLPAIIILLQLAHITINNLIAWQLGCPAGPFNHRLHPLLSIPFPP